MTQGDTEVNRKNSQDVDEDSSQQNSEQETADQEHSFKEGEILSFVKVRFPGNAKSFPFVLGKANITYGQKVVAMSDRGLDVGYINSFPYQKIFNTSMLPIKSISKLATEEDIQNDKNLYYEEKKAESLCKDLIEKHQLEMDITHVEFIQGGKKAVIYFVAPARVDFRALVKDLVTSLKMKIELRQFSVRDRTAAIGGIGPCGRQFCCNSFLTRYGRVNMKMTKNQNFTLIGSRLNGVCGQIKCCMAYEDRVYTEKRTRLPKENSFIQTTNGDQGKVLKLHLLPEHFDMLTDQGKIRRYVIEQFQPDHSLPNDYQFPERFDHVVNETSTIIGLKKAEVKRNDFDYDDFDDDSDDDEDDESDEDLNNDDDKNAEESQKVIVHQAPAAETSTKKALETDKKPHAQPKNHKNQRRHRNNRYQKKNKKD